MLVVENAGFYKGPLNSSEHYHSCCEIFYLKKGRILLSIEGKEYIPAEGSVHILSPMEKHAVTCLSEEYERYIIFLNLQNFEVYFSNTVLSSVLKNRPADYNHVFLTLNPDTEAVFCKCSKEHEQHSDCQYSNLRMVNLISELLILLYRSCPDRFTQSQENKRLTQIQKYIDDNYDKPLKILDLANMFYINQYYLSHTFKAFTGYSPKQYLSKVRFIHVRHLLATTDIKVVEISEMTGFETMNDLSRQFKSEFGLSPTEFRKSQSMLPYH